jgi:hypothetical protein
MRLVLSKRDLKSAHTKEGKKGNHMLSLPAELGVVIVGAFLFSLLADWLGWWE